jgi:hypothetical protein
VKITTEEDVNMDRETTCICGHIETAHAGASTCLVMFSAGQKLRKRPTPDGCPCTEFRPKEPRGALSTPNLTRPSKRSKGH